MTRRPSIVESWRRSPGYGHFLKEYVKVKWSRYRPGVAQRVGRGIALLFHDRGTRRGWVISGTPRPHFTPGKDPVPILHEVGWAPGPVWTGGKSRPHRDSIPGRPARSQSLYRLSYPAHIRTRTMWFTHSLISRLCCDILVGFEVSIPESVFSASLFHVDIIAVTSIVARRVRTIHICYGQRD